MKPSIWTSFFYILPPNEALGFLAEAGFKYLELSAEHMAYFIPVNKKEEEHTIEIFNETKSGLGIQIGQCHSPLRSSFISDERSYRHRAVDLVDCSAEKQRADITMLERWIDCCAKMEIPIVIVHPGGAQSYKTPSLRKRLLEQNYEIFSPIAENAQRQGVKIAIENMEYFDGDVLIKLVDKIGGEAVGICLDTSHANLSSGKQKDIPSFIRDAGDRIIATHISDNRGEHDDHLLPYFGEIDWLPIIKSLSEIDYTGLFNLEVPGESICKDKEILLLKAIFIRKLIDIMFKRATV